MRHLMSLLNLSAATRLTNTSLAQVAHPPKGRFKIVHQALKLAGLPAPLHYLNFHSLIGQPHLPVFQNAYLQLDRPLDLATVLVSSSPKMQGSFRHYSISQQCRFENKGYFFDQVDSIQTQLPRIHMQRQNAEFSVDLQVQLTDVITPLSRFGVGLFDYWSVLCHCTGTVQLKQQRYEISALGTYEYARSIHFPFVPVSFFTYQLVNLTEELQVILIQIRNRWNQVLQSKVYIRNIQGVHASFLQYVQFHILRVYPGVTTPNQQEMYLPREFIWQITAKNKSCFYLHGQSRGDFKFGLGAGYVGSFSYTVEYEGQTYQGESGYCEFIDCRSLKWQESNEKTFSKEKLLNTEPCLLKK